MSEVVIKEKRTYTLAQKRKNAESMHRRYREKKEEIKEYHRQHYQKNKDRIQARNLRWRENNRGKVNLASKKRYQKQREAYWGMHLKRRYNLSIEQYDEMAGRQGGVCAICKQPPSGKHTEKHLSVDHNHETNKVRGLLCRRCNFDLGRIIEGGWLQKAIEYMEKFDV